MKILAIYIKNLASLEGEHTIDFCSEPLHSAGIFAITGPTGAGKSTLLDALCLALYEQAPRYKNAAKGNTVTDNTGSIIQQNDPRKILRDGTGEGYAKVDFVGIDGISYRAGWTVRRARGKASGKLQKAEMELTNLRTGQPVPGKKMEILTEIENRVGLNFEQFTRSVLLAQGDFTAFLKAGKDEQSSLLEKLTGMQVYSEISKHIFDRWREEDQRLREWKVREEGVTLLEESVLLQLRQQLQETSEKIETEKQEIKNLEELISWRRQLAVLRERTEQSYNDFAAATEKQKLMIEREQKLLLVKSVQPAKSLLKRFQEETQSLSEKKNAFQNRKNELLTLSSRREEMGVSIAIAMNDLTTSEKEYEDALPDLALAKELDTRFKDKNEQLTSLNLQWNKIKEAGIFLKKQLETEEKKLQQLEEKKGSLLDWMTKNEGRRTVAEQEKLILTKLKDASHSLKRIEEKQQAAEKENNAEISLQQQEANIRQQQTEWEKAFKQQQEAFWALKKETESDDFRQLTEAENIAEKKVSEWTQALARWKILFHQLQEKNKLELQIAEATSLLKTKTAQLKEYKDKLPGLKVQKESAAELLQKAQLAVADNVENLRDSLEKGAPCPVCGSKEHPYFHENNQLQLVFSELKKSFDTYEADYNRYEKEARNLEQDCRSLRLDNEKWQQQLQDWHSKLQSGMKEWQSFSLYEVSSAVPEEKRQTWLQNELETETARLTQLRQKIEDANTRKEKIEKLRTWLSEQEAIGHQLENKRKDIVRKTETAKDNQLRLLEEKKQQERELELQKKEIATFLTTADWFEVWRENPEAFADKIRLFATKWREQQQEIETITAQLNQSALAFNSLKEKYHSLEAQWKSLEENLNSVQAQQQQIKKEREALLGGKPADEVETALKIAIQKARQELENKRKEKEFIDARFTRIETILTQEKKEIEQREIGKQSAIESIDKWLEGFNKTDSGKLTLEELESLLQYDIEWQEAEQIEIQKVKDRVLQTESVWKERLGALEKLESENKSEHSLETLLALQEKANSRLEELSKEFHRVDYRLKEDAENKKKKTKILEAFKKQEMVVEKWSKLNEVVGSADGKKFRQIAQEYTLEVLLSFANVHLKNLNPRYVLQKIPDGLGLQVMDLDMGREVRTVFSLSGGESFLVSLALALGLASLSSNRMKVESLFIDEGFGALDLDTLNIAMDALERLYNQGRKVGVISHVQEMTERIPVQIKVQKYQGGKSKLEIMGG